MKIAIAGHAGFIGKEIQKKLIGHEIIKIDRPDLYGDFKMLQNKIQSTDVLINLAGAPVSKRWTKANKELIYNSRILTTKNIVRALNGLTDHEKPKIFIQASAIGIYKTNYEHNEDSILFGDNFLARVVCDWEKELNKIDGNIITSIIRLGMVLGRHEGALKKLEPLYKLGLGGKIGNGQHVYSFIHVDDVIGGLLFIIEHKEKGVFNFTAPEPVTNAVFSKALASSLKRGSFFIIPKFFMKLLMGKSSIIVTEGQTVYPERVLRKGYKFKYPDIYTALNSIFAK